MSKKKSSSKKKTNKVSRRKSLSPSSHLTTKSPDTPKNSNKSKKKKNIKDRSIDSSSSVGKKERNHAKKKIFASPDRVLNSRSHSTANVDNYRKRLHQMDVEYRQRIEEENQKMEKLEAEQTEKIREQIAAETERKVKEIQLEQQKKIAAICTDLNTQQQNELARLDAEESEANDVSEQKRGQLEKEIQIRQEEIQADVEQYRKKRLSEVEEAIRKLHEQCEEDIKEYNRKRLEAGEQLLEQIRQKLDLEIKNEKQRGKLKTSMKKDRMKERFQKMCTNETEKQNEMAAQAIAKLRVMQDAELVQALANCKSQLQKNMKANLAAIQEEINDERSKLEKTIESMEDLIKCKLKEEQRQMERRIKMKQNLLEMLNMDDTRKITDEDFITSRYHWKIERSQIVVQSHASTVYQAKTEENATCYCKVTIINKWSTQHRSDFAKYSTRVLRYLSMNYSKAPYFVQVLDVLATDTKIYTFMEPFSSTNTIEHLLTSALKKKGMKTRKSKTPNAACINNSGFKRNELIAILSQVVKGARFLNDMFIAHAYLKVDNVTVHSGEGANDFGDCKVLLTGMTRPIVYYNVESDQLVPCKGYDFSFTEDESIDHLPPECFECEFQAAQLDLYSIGVLAYQLFRVHSPFAKYASSSKKIIAAKQSADSTALMQHDPSKADEGRGWEDDFNTLIASLTHPQQRKRIAFDDVLGHVFFKK